MHVSLEVGQLQFASGPIFSVRSPPLIKKRFTSRRSKNHDIDWQHTGTGRQHGHGQRQRIGGREHDDAAHPGFQGGFARSRQLQILNITPAEDRESLRVPTLQPGNLPPARRLLEIFPCFLRHVSQAQPRLAEPGFEVGELTGQPQRPCKCPGGRIDRENLPEFIQVDFQKDMDPCQQRLESRGSAGLCSAPGEEALRQHDPGWEHRLATPGGVDGQGLTQAPA